MAVELATLVAALDEQLKLKDFRDVSHNGLQVANPGHVTRVCCGVDASMEFFEAAQARGADFCFVHHGISWGDSLARLVGREYRLVSYLITHQMALYGAHLPLDAHPVLGNNAQLAHALGLESIRPAFDYHGNTIGVEGVYLEPMSFEAFSERVQQLMPQGTHQAIRGQHPQIRRVGIVSGGAAEEVQEACDRGLDAYLTGEMGLAWVHVAREHGIHFFAAGHYATEVWGPRAVANWIREQFDLPVEFIDFGLPW